MLYAWALTKQCAPPNANFHPRRSGAAALVGATNATVTGVARCALCAGGAGSFNDFQIGQVWLDPAQAEDAAACEPPDASCPERLPLGETCTASTPPGWKSASRVRTILARPGKGRPIDS